MNWLGTLALSAWLFFSLTEPAHAYLDPGIGSLVTQMLIAAGVGSMFFFRRQRDRVRDFVTGLFRKDAAPEAAPEEPTKD